MHQGHIATQHLKDKNETPTVMLHMGQINKTKKPFLPTEEECSQATSEDHDIGYTKNVLSCMEETLVNPNDLSNKCYVKPFQQGNMELHNGFIYVVNFIRACTH